MQRLFEPVHDGLPRSQTRHTVPCARATHGVADDCQAERLVGLFLSNGRRI